MYEQNRSVKTQRECDAIYRRFRGDPEKLRQKHFIFINFVEIFKFVRISDWSLGSEVNIRCR